MPVLVIDGAGVGRPRQPRPAVATAPRLRGGRLYSPELDPVETVWAYLRSNKLSNRVFETYDALVDACCDAWNWLIAQPDRITSIGSPPWAQVNA